ncbi:MAG TPA: hypothetical protein VNA68_03035 [Candidatus Dormibacteraeota bacterium]|nr:hypothetical protein [Candidatus Dormibacteraeota bacterium]
MSKNPIINALAALAYITIVALVMFYGSKSAPEEDNILAPIVFMSLFTLSAAVMGYLFVYQPLTLYLDGKKKVAASFFLRTIAAFGAITAILLSVLFSKTLF